MKRNTERALAGLAMLAFLALGGCPGSDDGPAAPHDTGEELVLADTILPLGLTGDHYDQTIQPTGGVVPYSWTVTTGQLPVGLAASGAERWLDIEGFCQQAGNFDFAVTVTDAEGTEVTASVSIMVVDELDLTGTWNAVIQVTAATGDCTGEVGSVENPQLTITQSGSELTVAGFLGEPGNQATGYLAFGNDVHVTGSWPEDGGTTEATHNWDVLTPNLVVGIEDWDWTIDTGPDCLNGKSRVTLQRVTR